MYILEVKGLGVSFCSGEREFWALKDVNLAFPETGLVAIKGKSGSGKSTLLNVLSGLLKPTRGKILLKGKRIDKLRKKDRDLFRRYHIATVFQHYNLVSGLSVYANVLLPLEIKGKRLGKAKRQVEAILRKFGLWDLRSRKVDTLSGGERQRVAICRCLITEPRIVFADEPTGALDLANGRLVMEMLKSVAKNHLVILVSHNEELIDEYAERTITLADGRIVEDTAEKVDEYKGSLEGGYARGGFWCSPFIRKNLVQNGWKNILTLASGLVGFCSLLICLGYFHGSPLSLKDERSKTLEFQTASISEKTYVEIPNSPLALVQQSRPTKETIVDALGDLGGYSIQPDLTYFLPQYLAFELAGEDSDPCSFLPVYDITLEEGNKRLLTTGEAPSANTLAECLVNEEFLSTYGEDSLGKDVSITYETTIQEGEVTEKVKLSLTMKISGAVDEFSFLNTPKIYYSYQALKEILFNVDLPSISLSRGEDTNVISFLNSASSDSSEANYAYLLFIHDFDEVDRLFELIGEYEDSTTLVITSSAYDVAKSFEDLSSAFSLCLLLFVGIAFFGVFAILAMASYSSITTRKKEIAILRTLGAGEGQLRLTFLAEALIVGIVSMLGALALSPLVSNFLNGFLESQFGLSKLVRIPYFSFLGSSVGLVLSLLALALLVAVVSTFIPLRVISKISIAEELRDE